jgi:O-succinylbenzoic acid--CoA ligase
LDKVKTLIVGGGQVDPKLIERFQNVPTDIYETYGMTETLTHVAIKPLNGSNKSKFFQALDGVHFEVDDRGCLVIHTLMLNPNPIVTNDLVDLVDEASFRWLGRVDNVINSGGIKIIPEVVEAKLTAVISDRRFFIAGVPDESLGKKVILIIEGERLDISLDSLEKYEKPKEIHFIEKFRVTTSGKIYRNSTLDMLRE